MNYFNFFSQSDKKTKKGERFGLKSMIVMSVLLIVLAGGVYGYFAIRSGIYLAQLDYLQEIKTNTKFIEQQSAATNTANLLAEAKTDYEYILFLSNAVGVLNTVNKELADTINDCMVKGSYISRFSVVDNQVTLGGYVENISMVTQIEKNLRESLAFQDIRISVVEDQEGAEPDMPQFTCLLTLRGGVQIQ